MQIVALDRSIYKYYREDIVVLSSQARDRLRLVASFEQLRDKGISGEEAAQILGKSRATLYRWRKRLERGPRHLEPISSRPKRVRKADWSPELVQRVESLRRDFPAWGKETLAPLIQGEGFEVSEATVGRILRKLMDRGVIHRVRYRRQKYKNSRRMRRLHAQRLPKWCPRPTRPGERLQIDTLHLVPAPGKWLKHFSASCPVSRWTVGEIYQRATSRCAARFLDKVIAECPFDITSIQVDGGSEFMDEFEKACRDRGITLYVLPPKSPKLNGTVERMQETWRGEFYEMYELPDTVSALRPYIQRFQDLYNTYRPHKSLKRKPPARYLLKLDPGVVLPPTVSKVLI